MDYDVIIAGAGPAGTVAGIKLIGCGARVLILDRGMFPRTKPCGGGISYRVFRRFPYLSEIFKSVPTNLVHRVVLISPNGEIVESTSPEPLYAMIRRYEFDAALLQKCRDGGIEIRERCTIARLEEVEDKVTVTTTSGEEFTSRLLIGADGVNSVVAIQSGLRNNWDAIQVAIDGTEESPTLSTNRDTMYVYYGIGDKYGYGYVFPKCEHVNLGVGYLLSYFRKYIKASPWKDHQEFVESLRKNQILTGHSSRENFHAFLLPVGGPLSRVSTNRIMLVGDAAGFVNGFTAEGIYYAMVSGEHAGSTARDALALQQLNSHALRSYDDQCLAEIGYELRKSVVIQKRLLAHPNRIDKIVALARKNSELRQLFTDFAVGKISYSQFKRQVIPKALPFYISYKVSKLWHKLLAR